MEAAAICSRDETEDMCKEVRLSMRHKLIARRGPDTPAIMEVVCLIRRRGT
jgi:hypothetical protein